MSGYPDVEPIIEVYDAPPYRACSTCFDTGGLQEIRIGHSIPYQKFTTAQCVVLCRTCREDLVRVLKDTV